MSLFTRLNPTAVDHNPALKDTRKPCEVYDPYTAPLSPKAEALLDASRRVGYMPDRNNGDYRLWQFEDNRS